MNTNVLKLLFVYAWNVPLVIGTVYLTINYSAWWLLLLLTYKWIGEKEKEEKSA